MPGGAAASRKGVPRRILAGMKPQLGPVGIWTGVLDAHSTARSQEAALELEDLGFETLWIPEAVGREPFVQAANLLAATSRLRLATGIANIYARDAMTMAAAQKTLAEAYPGRFLLGLGVSHAHLVARLRKHSYDKPLSYMSQYLDDMDDSLFMAVGPLEAPPRVLAALGPRMLRLAAAKAAGAHPYFTTPDHTATARSTMGPESLLAPEQMVVLEGDPAVAREIARKAMAVYLRAPNYLNNLARLGFGEDDLAGGGSDRLVDAVVAWGSLDVVAARVRAHIDAGADHVCLQVLCADTALPLAQWRQLAALIGQGTASR
jgi:probable F420-dependent oxidoreductase